MFISIQAYSRTYGNNFEIFQVDLTPSYDYRKSAPNSEANEFYWKLLPILNHRIMLDSPKTATSSHPRLDDLARAYGIARMLSELDGDEQSHLKFVRILDRL